MQPLVLAIEPDVRQAAIVKRIVREKVLADVAVVDSRDAAMEAMRTTVPDVLLLSALLSPRDEDELVAHLRSRRDAEHLQTHTIPQLASTIGGGEEEKPRGLLSAFKRKKGPESAPAGCDPDLFAEEIRVYLQRASERKREAKAADRREPLMAPIAAPVAKPAAPAQDAPVAEDPAAASSWASPFEWRPSRATSPAPIAEPETRAPEPVALVNDPLPPLEDFASPIFDPPAPIFDPPLDVLEPPAFARDAHVEIRDAHVTDRDPLFDTNHSHLAARDAQPPTRDLYLATRVKYPLSVRKRKGWWFVEGAIFDRKDDGAPIDPDSELRSVLKRLAVPAMIAGVTYAEGCRIRRVRLATA